MFWCYDETDCKWKYYDAEGHVRAWVSEQIVEQCVREDDALIMLYLFNALHGHVPPPRRAVDLAIAKLIMGE